MIEIEITLKVILMGTEGKRIFATIYIGEHEICTIRGTHIIYADDNMYIFKDDTHSTIEDISTFDVEDYRINRHDNKSTIVED